MYNILLVYVYADTPMCMAKKDMKDKCTSGMCPEGKFRMMYCILYTDNWHSDNLVNYSIINFMSDLALQTEYHFTPQNAQIHGFYNIFTCGI